MNSILVILVFATAAAVTNKNKLNIINYVNSTISNKTGVIKSLGYPYSQSNESVLFVFTGLLDERVQIIFDEFNLYEENSNQRCTGESSVISYQRNGKTEKFCGKMKPLPIMSTTRIFELYYSPVNLPSIYEPKGTTMNDNLGFNATYRFVKNYGIDSGIQEDGTSNCEFTFNSEITPSGVFNSPNFHGPYPTPITCYYVFIGKETNLVFEFTQFNLLGNSDCKTEIGEKDMVTVTTRVDMTAPPNETFRYCGKQQSLIQITLPGKTAFVIFKHDYRNYSDAALVYEYSFIGFNASFLFTNNTVSGSSRTNKLPDVVMLSVGLYFLSNQRWYF